ncbi:PREDICTED: uncharacterized protein LOC108779981 [Cyphomyrmex costatus]|uniref:uncharacterized protein LOC108779981 n=1 Tax=Cyphomyrmex costatus TaxID=456900 RepID=UPI0008523FC0|nr:PREDICTED: uncharacterized protein LOC108779981 [Cyphomyrmex costatus]
MQMLGSVLLFSSFLFQIHIFVEKKYAIADLEVTVGDEKHLDVCVIAHNWISEDGENCLYPTYLAPKKQANATKTCMEPTAKFNTYPAIIRAWFVTYEEARRKLERAVDKTDLESDANKEFVIVGR